MAGLEDRRGDPREEKQEAAVAAAALQKSDDEAVRREMNRIIAEQKKKDLERLKVQLDTTSPQGMPLQSPKFKSPVIEKFSFLTKGRKHKNESPSPGLTPTTASSANASLSEINRTPTADSHKVASKVVSTGIEVGGKGIVPQTDAPASAINSGNRIVTVRCKHRTFSLDVAPETTPVDIIRQTSDEMPYDLEINPATCVVLESYGSLDFQRRLRRYEHIRDIMNTWDDGAPNCLIVAVSDSEDDNRDLDIAWVPKTEQPPPGFQLYLYHSNRPGKWNKRYITLLDNGQVIAAKKPNAGPTDKDATRLCCLSDYDIYMPTDAQVRRNLKPPKKHCFVVKSQERTTVFVNKENYVQLFSTDDANVAAQFRDRVHVWRSWYLVDRRPPEAKKAAPPSETPKASEKPPSAPVPVPKADAKPPSTPALAPAPVPKAEDPRPPQITLTKHEPKKSTSVASVNGHQLKVSVDESPYTIGEFEPLLDMKRFDKRLSQFGKDFIPPTVPDASTMPKSGSSHVKHSPAVASSSKEAGNSQNGPPKQPKLLVDTIQSTDQALTGFTGGGLLGERYEERKQANHAEETRRRPSDSNYHVHAHANGHHNNGNSDAHGRSRSATMTHVKTDGPFTEGDTLLNPLPPPPAPYGAEPDSPASSKPESPSWFPSAIEHTAKQRNAQQQRKKQQQEQQQPQLKPQPRPQMPRPSTSGGIVQQKQQQEARRPSLPFHQPGHTTHRPLPTSGAAGGSSPAAATHPNPLRSSPYLGPSSGAMSHSNRRDRPQPLVNLDGGPGDDSDLYEPPPQWRNQGGRGVSVPEGMHHIIDLIDTGDHNSNSNGPPPHHKNNSNGEQPLIDRIPSTSSAHTQQRRNNNSNNNNGPNRNGSGGPLSAPLPLARTRSKTAGAPPPSPLRPNRGDIPPLPPIPPFVHRPQQHSHAAYVPSSPQQPPSRGPPPPPPPREREQRQRGYQRHLEEQQHGYVDREPHDSRNFRSNGNHNNGRTGTLRVV